nr:immunoglobulin light chain junction region [Macaca mulatta]MOV77561.1 immunoglobulin light chain junction region [Macaca mulatta]MOV77598.1 immunoglobulin light chain junction region [Macaca mulatta]MOV77604.1 immunoglobulin light chain junction region [Macaca mulatta]MOV77607.1 immunoglobulin light chain junction region [Macaca mulatta]
CMQALEFPWTF